MDDINGFMKNAKGLSKNPLGIIALFISLIYAFACAVLGVSLNNLTASNERLPLIWFIIIFPVIILLAFIYLVVNHHEKLYAPSDFRDDNAFIKAMDKKDITIKTKNEVKELTEVLNNDTNQKDEVSIKDIKEIANKFLDNTPLEEKYKNAESWAISEFSLNHNLDIKRNQKIVSPRFGTFELDGICKTEDNFYAIEVKYWTNSSLNNALKLKIQDTLRYLNSAKNVLTRKNFIPVILLVMDSVDDSIKAAYIDFVKQIDNDAQLDIFEYQDLKRKYKE
jgi:hypothetical protein